MSEEEQKSAPYKTWFWACLILLFLPGYFLSAVMVVVICEIFPPSVAVRNVLSFMYLPLMLILQQVHWLERIFFSLVELLASLFR